MTEKGTLDYTIKKFVTGPIDTNTYVVSEENVQSCLVIDPSDECEEVLAYIREQKWNVAAVCLTHGHFDHLLGIGEITTAYPHARIYVHNDEMPLLHNAKFNGSVMLGMEFSYQGPVELLLEGELKIGPFSFIVLHIPGHSPGGCAFVFGKNCISGDSLFAGSIGRTDFPGSDHAILMKNIRQKLLTLPDETVIWPGHGGRTTIGREKRHNPFLV